ncbi:MAG: acyl-ACP--UDP-N-acetylglucosamine O-acyltransferase [Muribaculaceae bacterium]|nr:acyl-ACP--UDP-N-acetylglucosamine O-acyltransferase [Muribaculaceae bacterium]MBQ2235662.1 acyl-ACP--UDP-N-acetylglucosamine O-acyltransferase [Muribaculaceae bacterium]MBQ2485286.1 acyl-ACP--UDP-N-acetylglucosamine O-acyltransferase [Muribaculaceae bacterium]MBQ4006212.1 acyl-ACP--UDP-N-acetylglucosamine O-acyltransferase [Muribaculaceae bacterium]
MNIHPLSAVHPDAHLGEGVQVGPFVTIDANVEIGEGTIIDAGAVIHSGARIGKNCHIHSNAVVSDIPQDLKFQGEDTITIIGDGTTVRECATIHRGTASRGKTVVGNNCLIMAYSHVAHDCVLANNIIMSNAVQVAGEVEIGDFAVLGGGTLVHQFTRIGPHVMIQGGSQVTKDLPPFSLIGRNPICFEGVNAVGLRRRGFTLEQINAIQSVYRMFYQSKLNVAPTIEKIIEELPASRERDIITEFIAASTRGVVRSAVI